MEIKNENKFKGLFKKFGALSLACVFALAIALTIAFSIKNQPVSGNAISFSSPMNNAVVVKDYSEDKLQHNESMKFYAIHLAVDLVGEDDKVFAVSDGIVKEIDKDNDLEGTKMIIEHADGFVSVYCSLDNNLLVSEGEQVKKGQEIGKASDSSIMEKHSGGHLHLELFKDGIEVDPNLYFDFQNK